ncbi:hypothetical protein DYB38_013966, partial [Aphanomyces astaci]
HYASWTKQSKQRICQQHGLEALSETYPSQREDGGIAGHSDHGRWTVKLPGKQLFYVVDDNYELIVSKYALMSIGLDMDRLLEQAAVRQIHEDGDDIGDPGADEDIAFVDAAAKGVWRTKFRGTDLPANVKAVEIRLKADACPNRCKPRKVNPLTGMFVEAFGKQLEQDQVIYANSSSSHCSPVNPVMKPEGKKLVKTSDKCCSTFVLRSTTEAAFDPREAVFLVFRRAFRVCTYPTQLKSLGSASKVDEFVNLDSQRTPELGKTSGTKRQRRKTEHRKYVPALGKWTKTKQPKHVYKPPPPKLRPLDDTDFVWSDLNAIR